ncbi:hypothetical protein KFL_006370060 [Klebsormidium nitens]|uniref:YchJ-like middle NTF2-like domain-containing protein n=1 Tax=Klebsormidium nitens TaxID=105231 RepID=A0A1Y1IMP8_KLENI|nr:hypothetical protein KFL_006370060 [Klebsormidium nitens]|eukprot:GAQ90421.1 hypothetical protein KFL_006370060 [Klebsormidium nitens]
MRSRYTAYVKGLVDYLVDTTHPDHPDYDTMRKSVRDTTNRVRFKKLDIQDSTNGENEAFVTFRFDFSLGRGIDRHITERSRFVKEEGRWLFIGTEILEPQSPSDEDSPLAPLSNLDV